jgi:hypothetical protein
MYTRAKRNACSYVNGLVDTTCCSFLFEELQRFRGIWLSFFLGVEYEIISKQNERKQVRGGRGFLTLKTLFETPKQQNDVFFQFFSPITEDHRADTRNGDGSRATRRTETKREEEIVPNFRHASYFLFTPRSQRVVRTE